MKTIRTAGAASRAVAFALFACFLGASCSDALLDEMGRLAAEANRPAISPSAGSIITAHETITLSFDSDMAAGAVSVGGNIGLAAPAAAWADPRTLNLNLGNVIAWSAGSGKRLTVSISESGQTVVYEYAFEVFNGVCVGDPAIPADGSDAGTVLKPYRTVQQGIDLGKTLYIDGGKGPAIVRVGKYTYTKPCTNSSFIADVEAGVSLIGGYAANFSSRSTGDRSILVDSSTDAVGSSKTDPVRVINIDDPTVTSATVIRGFEARLGSGGIGSTTHCGVYCKDGSPSFDDVMVTGSTTSSANT